MNNYSNKRKGELNTEKGTFVKPTLSKPTDKNPKDSGEESQTNDLPPQGW